MINNIAEYLEETAKKYPDKIGFVDDRNSFTFQEIDHIAKRIAMMIPDDVHREPVVVLMEKSACELNTFLGIAYSGNFYVPIDTKMPIERIRMILKLAKARVVITDTKSYDRAEEIINGTELLLKYEAHVRYEIDNERLSANRSGTIDTDPLYVLFTSGSTGIPKGVIVTHRAVCDYIDWLISIFEYDENTVFGNQAPFYFDNSILDIYSTIRVGARLHIIPESYFVFPNKLIRYLNDNEINTIFWVPSALVAVANSKILDNIRPDYLQNIMFCGEVMPNKQLNMWRKVLPEARYANLYGPTEITDVCSYYIIDREFGDDEPLPIGKACRNTEILILNEHNQKCKENEIGELCVRGTCLSLGYYGNPEKTKEVFVQNPLNDKWNELIYRTGDLVKLNEFGEILYICRKDFQIKHMGHRIELGEIETAAYSLAYMKQCCSLYNEQKKQIILFCVTEDEEITEKDIYKGLQSKIPKYMLPAVIWIKAELPLNINGKIDRVKLKEEMEKIND